nr:pyridoxal-phosphate dependent enzyme [Microbulbifer rhizosphaerae]
MFPCVEVWIRRDDLLDPIISGNKAYKLLFNLLEARKQGVDTLITCGGAWSNHIHATAAAGCRFGFNTVGIIRGERSPQLSATLQDAERFGMRLLFITRQSYRRRDHPGFLKELGIVEQCPFFIPEGGANLAGARGAQLLGQIIDNTCPVNADQVWLACGTGLTWAGVQCGIGKVPVIAVPILKAADSIRNAAIQWRVTLANGGKQTSSRSTIDSRSGYHCGGYAKYPNYLHDFQQTVERETGIPLDPVYTAKLLYGLHREIALGHVPAGSKILVLHSGGLQGRRGLLG